MDAGLALNPSDSGNINDDFITSPWDFPIPMSSEGFHTQPCPTGAYQAQPQAMQGIQMSPWAIQGSQAQLQMAQGFQAQPLSAQGNQAQPLSAQGCPAQLQGILTGNSKQSLLVESPAEGDLTYADHQVTNPKGLPEQDGWMPFAQQA
ncbi:hypothetical protein WJX77_009383 [Trebouxia sp. C0004]